MMKICVLPGDGIGPEVVGEARRLVDHVSALDGIQVNWESHAVGGCAIDTYDKPLPDGVMEACQAADAVLLGAVGGPKWDNPTAKVRPEQAILGLRKGLGVYANLRPVYVFPMLENATPLKPEVVRGVDIIVLRELTGGKGVPVVYDSIGKDTFMAGLDCLQPRGIMVTYGNASGPVPPFAPGVLGAKGSLYVTRQTLFTHIASRASTQAMADDLFAVVASGAVKIRIDQRYTLDNIQQAHKDLEARKTTGCTIITL